jgi:predicted DNA-binding transcriptional regulator YafY
MLADDEALAITLSLIAARRQGSPAGSLAIEGALAKIERVLPEELRARLQAVQSVVTFSTTAAPPQPNGELIMAISAAAQQQQRMLLRYQSGDQETVRFFDPYGLVYHWDRWYTVGWCHLRDDVRVFRLDRVRDATPEDGTFTRPPDFDSLAYVLDSLATAPWSWSVEVLLETTLEEARRRIPPGNAILTPADGGVLVQLGVDRLDWMARTLMLVGCPFIVRHPPELRDALRQLAAEAAAMADRVEA